MSRWKTFRNWWRSQLLWKRYLGYFAVVVALFYTVEDIRGYYALKKAKEEYLAAGFRLDLDEGVSGESIFDVAEIIQEIVERRGKAEEGILFSEELANQVMNLQMPGNWAKAPSENVLKRLSNGLRNEIWTEEQLVKIDRELAEAKNLCDWRNVSDKWAAQLFGRLESGKDTRENYRDNLGLLTNRTYLVDLPDLGIDMSLIEHPLSWLASYFVPRGWVWQNEARLLNEVRGDYSNGLGTGFSGYRAFLSLEYETLNHLQYRVDSFAQSVELARIAVALSQKKDSTGIFPDPATYTLPSSNYLYKLDAEELPELWYSPVPFSARITADKAHLITGTSVLRFSDK